MQTEGFSSSAIALCRSIIEQPGEDTPRLALADELEEYDVAPWLSSLIRDQFRIQEIDSRIESEGLLWMFGRQHRKLLREKSLLRERSPMFATAKPSPFHQRDHVSIKLYERVRIIDSVLTFETTFGFERGFVYKMETDWGRFAFHSSLFLSQPITQVELADFTPYERLTWLRESAGPRSATGRFRFRGGRFGPEPVRENHLPKELFALLPCRVSGEGVTNRANWLMYKTEDLAKEALSIACVRYGRRLAGLPQLPIRSDWQGSNV